MSGDRSSVEYQTLLAAAHIRKQVSTICGDLTYKGTPCDHGHDGTRYTVSGNCVACARAASRKRYDKVRKNIV